MIYTKTGSVFSPCKLYRYTLGRWWSPFARGRRVNFLCLNCSTATATDDDPTIRRCVGFARSWGYDGMVVTNIFAFRATDPRVMKAADDPIGPQNDYYVLSGAKAADLVVCAWGVHGGYLDRGRQVTEMLTSAGVELHCLTVTKAGQPGHPLYIAGDTKPRLYKKSPL